ncbi:MAG TPA: glycoside hydrolase family 15 protein [Planctomycetaceae bacterium]|nr:glycoside hydrolase family 15 protein [Planctomycetaceae bacterium]
MDWQTTAPKDWIRESTTLKDVRELTLFLEQQGTFDFPMMSNGLFSAAAGEGDDFALSGYHNVWVRDNIQVAWAHLAVQDAAATPCECVRSLMAFFAKYRHRLTDIIEGWTDASDPMQRPHIRFDGTHLKENTEKWAHAQNDALGYFLWLTAVLVERGDLAKSEVDWTLIAELVRYFQVIEVWQDEDSGHWEEVRKVAASSIGCVVAGLDQLRTLMKQDDIRAGLASGSHPITIADVATLSTTCRTALLNILPAECVQSDPLKNRRYDAALLFLIYPLNVLQDRELEDQILADVKTALQGPYGIRRYPGDSYWCADYRTLLSAEDRTGDFSDDLKTRDNLLKPGMEAQWCIFDPIVACIHGLRYLADGNPASLQLQIEATQRSLSQLTPADSRFPQYRCPESYFSEAGQWIPNDITPLLWTQGNLWQALKMLEKSLAKVSS